MGKRSQSTGCLSELQSLQVQLHHYVELLTCDNFSPSVLKCRLEQHLLSPWREPRKPIKDKLRITYTSLLLSKSSWWPYRLVPRVDFEAVERFITFEEAGRLFAIGLHDHDFAQKQFVVMSTKSMSDTVRLSQLMQAQLSVWKPDSGSGPMACLPLGSNPLPLHIHSSQQSLAQSATPGLATAASTISHKCYCQQTKKSPQSVGTVMLNRCTCSSISEPSLVPDIRKPVVPLFHNATNHHRTSPSTLDASRNTRIHFQGKTKLEPSCSTNKTRHSAETMADKQTWEVDIKYIRYDPKIGNVVDRDGSVYLYTAHQIRE